MHTGCFCLLCPFVSHSKVQIGFMSSGNPRSLWASLQKEMKRRQLPGDFNESYFYPHGTIKSLIMKQRLVCLFFSELYLYLTLTIFIHFFWIKPSLLKSCASQLIKDSYNLIYCIIPNMNVLTGEADILQQHCLKQKNWQQIEHLNFLAEGWSNSTDLSEASFNMLL